MRDLQGQASGVVALRDLGADSRLDDYFVSSNSTGMIHSEQMVALPGRLVWQSEPVNRPVEKTKQGLKIFGVALFAAGSSTARWPKRSCWIGDFDAGRKASRLVHWPHRGESLSCLAIDARRAIAVDLRVRPEGRAESSPLDRDRREI